jgi:hypothetical protein
MEVLQVSGWNLMLRHLVENVEVRKRIPKKRRKALTKKMRVLRKETRILGNMTLLGKAIIQKKQIERTLSLCTDLQ